jgi:hypothetical protein
MTAMMTRPPTQPNNPVRQGAFSILLILLLFYSTTTTVAAFTTTRHVTAISPTISSITTTTTVLFEVIEPLTENEAPVDEGLGGVRLAKESAIKISGMVKHKPGSADATAKNLLRYFGLQTVENAPQIMENLDHVILCIGQGVELYKDPGTTTKKEVFYAPLEAVKDALTTAASAMSSTHLVFNFLGGDDLMLGEVLNACNDLTINLDIPTKAQIMFNSLCHDSIPSGTCTVTVVSLGMSGQEEGISILSDIEKALAKGELYHRDGVYYTVIESDINPAIA